MITTFYPPYSFGGDATYVRSLSRGLVSRGHEVTVVACRDSYEFLRGGTPAPTAYDENGDDGVTVHWLRSGAGALSPMITQQTGRPGLKSAPLARILAEPFDVINYHNISLVGGPDVLRHGTAKARIYTLHEHWLVCPTHIFWKNKTRACDGRTCFSCCLRSGIPPQLWRYTGMRDRLLKHVDLMLSPSEYTAARHQEFGVERPITVLPLFSSLEPEGGRYPASPRPTFLFVGRVTAPKGVETLLRVAASLPEIDLHIIGEGELLSSLSRQYAGAPNVAFLGKLPQDQLISHYRKARALILPSISPETFGLAIVEAAACGAPSIVAKGTGGSAEIVDRTGGGIVYDGEAELKAAILNLANDPTRADSLGALALAGVKSLYTRERHIRSYLDAVTEVIDAKQGAGTPA